MRGEEAASPLAVILATVLVAVAVTTLIFFIFVDTRPPGIDVEQAHGAFHVIGVQGNLHWEDLEVRLLDQAGADHAEALNVPQGRVEAGDRLTFARPVPGGEYLLVVLLGGEELERVRARL